ncbi:MAG: fused MFS/spermidine synthase, partial [Planctomycetota bacterium]
ALAALGAALAAGEAAPPPLPTGVHLLAAAESPYQAVRVVEDRREDPPRRYLEVNEGFGSYQSVWQPARGLLAPGYYYNDFALPAWWAAAEGAGEGAEGSWRVLVLGLGGGTAFRVLAGASPPGLALELTGVELDPAVVELARAHLELGAEGGERILAGLDARVALRALGGGFDEIVLDCYANQVEIPPHLGTVELFAEVRAALAPGGWLVANLGGFGFDDPVVAAVAASAARAFAAPVLVLRVPFARNYTLVARRDAPLPLDAAGSLRAVPPPVDRLVESRALPGSWRLVAPGGPGPFLTDRHSPVEHLERRSIAEARGRLRRAAGG